MPERAGMPSSYEEDISREPEDEAEPVSRAELLAQARQELHETRLQLLVLQRRATALQKLTEGLEALEELAAETPAGETP